MLAGMYDEAATERWVREPAKDTPAIDRSPFERDRARVLHSSALRRLAAKTQVVGVGESDFPRTRLTHSLECAQIGRELGESLGCDPDLVDAACLAHDLGHPPFGHNGETALDEAAAACGGFEGNAQSLRVLTRLEAKIPEAGLNLTRATLDAATKYPWPRRTDTPKFGVYDEELEVFEWLRAGAPEGRRCLESQVMDWADDVAYSVHDLEDGIHAGHIDVAVLRSDTERDAVCSTTSGVYTELSPSELDEVLRDLLALPWWPAAYDGSPSAQVGLKRMTSELTARFSQAAWAETRRSAGERPLTRYDADLRVPERVRAECALLKGVAAHYVMRRRDALVEQARQRELMHELVTLVRERAPDVLDPLLRPAHEAAPDDPARLRVVVDQVASLTDLSARAWHSRLVHG